jgi:hypothetical protein
MVIPLFREGWTDAETDPSENKSIPVTSESLTLRQEERIPLEGRNSSPDTAAEV